MAFAIDLDRLRATAAKAASAANPEAAGPVIADPYASFTGHYESLLVAGLEERQAFDLAEAMCMRQERSDDRHVCALECRNYRRGVCMDHRSAGVAPQLGELAFVLQRCAGFVAKHSSDL